MAYNGPSNVKDNFGRFQAQATINISKQLRKLANEVRTDISQDVAVQLKDVYKNNVEASYEARSSDTYTHTGTFSESIDVEIERDPGIGRDRVKIVLRNRTYDDQPSQRDVTEVYKYLTEGTNGGSRGTGKGYYYYFDELDTISATYNEPTPKHEFELHTQEQMKGYLTALIQVLEFKKRINERRKR